MSTAEATSSPWERWNWAFPAVWLVFLVYPVLEVLDSTGPVWAKVLTIGAVVAFGVVYMLGFVRWADHPWRVFVVLVALVVATLPLVGPAAISMLPFLGAFTALCLPSPWWQRTALVIALVPVLGALTGLELFYFLIVWPVLVACSLIRFLETAHEQHREHGAELALVAERDRVARDVHDVLGHSLTVLSLKAELAGRLVETDPARATAELEEIQQIARQALAEVRTTVGGLRASNLAAELAAAPRVLADAGVRTTVHGAVADTDPQHRAMLGWVLRETVTNVVRHAHAQRVTIELRRRGMVVTDDGAGLDAPEGNGLRGMRERVEGAGGTLLLSDAAPGTKVQVEFA
ncbi:MAG: sensor histidine kinase [Nocardioides sp.]|uniref:sensor histidine kinase n=1 Tax=Nocardioides sp. TaxID=35761 RepID=UPI003F00C21F